MPLIPPLTTKPLGLPPETKAQVSHKVTARSDEQFCPGHPLALPVRIMTCSERALWKSVDYRPGRVILNTTGPSCSTGEGGYLREDLEEFVCGQDVIWAPLYRGEQKVEGPYPPEGLPCAGHNAEVLREVGSHVYAVLVGNRHFETGYLHGIWGPEDFLAFKSSEQVCGFVYRAGEILRKLGCRPAFGLIDLQILLDAWRIPGRPLRKALQDVGALVICFLGFKFYEHMRTLGEGDVNQYIIPRTLAEAPPCPKLRTWLEDLECWSGLDYGEGLVRGNDIECHMGGWSGGLVGELPDGTR